MSTSPEAVMLYLPNLVGYIRVGLMLASFVMATTNWKISIGFYFLAFFGDVVDGYIARAFDQCSRFGGILDMVTDRVSTLGLLMIVAQLYPAYNLYFILLAVLDIMSHWFHVMSVTGHHKAEESLGHRNPLLRWYYSVFPLFAYCCVGTELFYILLYVLNFHFDSRIHTVCYYVCLPACLLKNLVNIVQLCSAGYAIAEVDAAEKNLQKSK